MTIDYESLSKEYVLRAVTRDKSLIFERAEGSRLWDIHGKVYLDTMSGSAGPAMVGHAHPAVAEAVARQMAQLPSTNILHLSIPVIEFCRRLAAIAPPGLTKTFLCTGGGEAVEAAIKFAMRVTGRPEVISLTGAYHGMSLATMGLTGMPALRKWLPGAMRWPSFRQIPSADAYRPPLGDGPESWRAAVHALEADLDGASSGQVAAFLMEIVQGPNGHTVFPAEYYRGVQRVCRERGVLLIVDEIQTGLARCGATWACDLFDVQPDILIAGKALGGGVPMGTFTTRKDLIPEGLESEAWHMLTFMNQPMAAAAGLAVLDIVEKERLAERARTLGAAATEWFRQLARRFEVIGDVRGPGLFIGVDFVEDRQTKAPATVACRKAWEFALDHGLITQFGGMGSNVLKFKPPLTTPDADFKHMLEIAAETVAFIQREVDQQKMKPVA
ncbi:MAG TPA: aspartate aminotransferase family protein, partial [Candidatus Acidoferrales bacterium]|nr:aspartate aminotransferase family protein [Candidatus Acidoferrales bacterium]